MIIINSIIIKNYYQNSNIDNIALKLWRQRLI